MATYIWSDGVIHQTFIVAWTMAYGEHLYLGLVAPNIVWSEEIGTHRGGWRFSGANYSPRLGPPSTPAIVHIFFGRAPDFFLARGDLSKIRSAACDHEIRDPCVAEFPVELVASLNYHNTVREFYPRMNRAMVAPFASQVWPWNGGTFGAEATFGVEGTFGDPGPSRRLPMMRRIHLP
jgi:hypothetical protein